MLIAAFPDPLRNTQIGVSDVLKQGGKVAPDGGVFLEQKLIEHHLMEGDRLLQV
ncbi:MAG: hypothetical protein JO000_08050 [Alphaproteobacteria bacterium]|nr:hypothetical protein [Alphaproteobacteria bacterium]